MTHWHCRWVTCWKGIFWAFRYRGDVAAIKLFLKCKKPQSSSYVDPTVSESGSSALSYCCQAASPCWLEHCDVELLTNVSPTWILFAFAAFLFAFFFMLKSGLLLTHHAGQEMQVRCFDNAVIVAKTCSYFFFTYAPPLYFRKVHSLNGRKEWIVWGRRILALSQIYWPWHGLFPVLVR